MACGEDPNTFLVELDVAIEQYKPAVDEIAARSTEQSTLQVSIPTPNGPISHTPHTLMDDSVFEDVDDGRGTEFGDQVHEFAEAYALGDPVAPSNEDERHVATFLDSLSGELRVEEDAYLPLEVDGERVTISGIVDLVHLLPDRVEIIDYKTDLGRHAEAEYRKQLSVYSHIATEMYPNRDVTASIFYTASGELVSTDPLSISALREEIRRLE